MTGRRPFEPVRFNGLPELKEAFLSGYMPATFILAPLAMALREQGVPIKIVYLGHRDGTAMMVHKDSKIYRIEDLKGKTIAVPNRYSNQRLLIFKALKERGMTHQGRQPRRNAAAGHARRLLSALRGRHHLRRTLHGPDRTGRLRSRALSDQGCLAELHFLRAGRQRGRHQEPPRRMCSAWWTASPAAANGWTRAWTTAWRPSEFVGKNYYNQDPRLLRFVLSKPPDRVKYTNLAPLKKDFEEIEALAVESGIMQGTVRFEDYVDPSFVKDDASVQPYAWDMGTNLAANAAAPPPTTGRQP